jgi:fused signal recognition particle receptor
MAELAKMTRVAGREAVGAPHETLLVLDATVGSNGLAQGREFAKAGGVTGLVLTKLDGTAKGGIAVAVVRELGVPSLPRCGRVGRGPHGLRRGRSPRD